MSDTSEFSVPEPFAPKPAPRNDQSGNLSADTPTEETTAVEERPTPLGPVNVALTIFAAMAVGFALGYAFCRYQETLLRQSKLDRFLDYANDWVREHGPKLTDPIKEGIESTSSTVGRALRDVGSSAARLDQLNPFRQRRRAGLFK
jgi:hypothetical protein